jgi:hypothetical protein
MRKAFSSFSVKGDFFYFGLNKVIKINILLFIHCIRNPPHSSSCMKITNGIESKCEEN